MRGMPGSGMCAGVTGLGEGSAVDAHEGLGSVKRMRTSESSCGPEEDFERRSLMR